MASVSSRLSAIPLDEQRFDLVAKIPQGATKEQFRAMMQALLTERFHLKAHTVSKEFPAFDLTVAKGGPKFKESDPTASGPPRVSSKQSISGGFLVIHLHGERATMADLLHGLLHPGDAAPFADKTGLAGKYDFNLDYTTELSSVPSANAETPPAPDLAVALSQTTRIAARAHESIFGCGGGRFGGQAAHGELANRSSRSRLCKCDTRYRAATAKERLRECGEPIANS
jgi:uncharacterized protein (TIGR03435 family)